MVLIGAFQVLVSHRTGLTDFGVGIPVSGREHPDTEHLIGHFVNTVVLRADLSGRPDFGGLVDRVRDRATTALQHQDVTFDRVVRELQPARDLSRNPLVQLMFAFQSGVAETWSLAGLAVTRLPLHSRTSKFDLLVSLGEAPDGALAGSIEYPIELFDDRTVHRLAADYVALVARLVERPDLPVAPAVVSAPMPARIPAGDDRKGAER
jgi:non-ribosomal peptide synthetase component F